MNQLANIDEQILLFFNGSDSLFLDGLMTTLTSGLTWLPLYVALLYLVIKNNETMPQILLTIGAAVVCVAITAGVTNLIVKPLVARPRPCNDPFIRYVVDVVFRMPLKDFSFFSAHAANTFGLAVFFLLLIRDRIFTVAILLWSLLNCYTRLYLGLHYPSDILCGLLFGGIVGFVVYVIYLKFYLRIAPEQNFVSSHYTPTGYSVPDVNIVVTVLVFILLYAVVRAAVVAFPLFAS